MAGRVHWHLAGFLRFRAYSFDSYCWAGRQQPFRWHTALWNTVFISMHHIVRIAGEVPRVLKTVRQNRLTVIWAQEGRGKTVEKTT